MNHNFPDFHDLLMFEEGFDAYRQGFSEIRYTLRGSRVEERRQAWAAGWGLAHAADRLGKLEITWGEADD